MTKKVFRSLKHLELHHKALVFIGEVFITVIVTRFVAAYYNVDPFIRGFELHHFDYGITILIIALLCLIIDRNSKQYALYFALSAMGLGLVIDELWFIRLLNSYNEISTVALYDTTFVSVIIILSLIAILAGVVNYKIKK